MGNALFGMQGRTAQELAYIVLDFISKNIFNIIGGILILLAGWVIARFIGKIIQLFLLAKKADVTITKFLVDVVRLLIMATALLIALGNFGITIAPFIAGLGAIGFGASFALQGPLSNYAAGATLIFTKPFKVGDILEVGGNIGQVEDMTLARTIMRTLDGTRIIIPNKKIIGEIMHNYSEFKRLDLKVGVSYSSDMDKALSIVKDAISREKRVASRPAPKVGIEEFADSSVVIYARLWCAQSSYWDVKFDLNKAIFDAFRAGGIQIPFPQRDVHIIGRGTWPWQK
ncbi:MAG: mechanosensitive ion channel family protein [Candidatus Omnitrophica bacterium]|nr:mechanosensitive ion channel family protein [Candidatus Omnitrophota bacterium]MCM8791126.1 mechanosensitive ion channel family protein [Candidatus Omnitrophota bacterium]